MPTGTSVLSSPITVMPPGTAACAHTHATGTTGASVTTAGRNVRILPASSLCALLPNVIWIAPSFEPHRAHVVVDDLAGRRQPRARIVGGQRRRPRPRLRDRGLDDVGERHRVDDLLAHDAVGHARQRHRREQRNDGDRDDDFHQREAGGRPRHIPSSAPPRTHDNRVSPAAAAHASPRFAFIRALAILPRTFHCASCFWRSSGVSVSRRISRSSL